MNEVEHIGVDTAKGEGTKAGTMLGLNKKTLVIFACITVLALSPLVAWLPEPLTNAWKIIGDLGFTAVAFVTLKLMSDPEDDQFINREFSQLMALGQESNAILMPDPIQHPEVRRIEIREIIARQKAENI